VASIEATFPGGVRGTALTALAILGLLVIAQVALEDRIVQYAVYLIVFTVWMAWFVLAGVNFIGQR
jgi:hypothetical protein